MFIFGGKPQGDLKASNCIPEFESIDCNEAEYISTSIF